MKKEKHFSSVIVLKLADVQRLSNYQQRLLEPGLDGKKLFQPKLISSTSSIHQNVIISVLTFGVFSLRVSVIFIEEK